MQLLLGTYTPKLDEKNRLFLPAKFRETFQSGIVITKGEDHCSYLYTEDEFARAYNEIKASDRPNKQIIAKIFTSDALADLPDKQGRVLVPAVLREYAALKKELVVIGAGNRAELWDKKAWDQFQTANQELYSETIREVF